MENAAILEAERSPGAALAEELSYTDAPQRVPVLDNYFRARAARVKPHIVEHIELPELPVIQTPFRIRCRELLARFGPYVVFASAVAGMLWFWPPY